MIFLLHIQTDCCRYPYILIPSGLDRNKLKQQSVLIHDNSHRATAKAMGLFSFFWKYLTDDCFRWQEEQKAFADEIHFYKSKNCYIFHDAFVDALILNFTNMCNRKQADKFISNFTDLRD